MTLLPVSEPQRWCDGQQFGRYLTDLVGSAVNKLRPGLRVEMGKQLTLGADGADLDSLERFNLAVVVAEALQLPLIEHPERFQEMENFADWIAEARRCAPGSTAVGFRSSGSTGEAQFTVHSIDLLREEVAFFARQFADRKRILSLVPAHHIYGFLFTVLLPQQLGVNVLDCRGHAPTTVALLARPGDLIVGFPDFWGALENHCWQCGVEGVSSGAACPDGTARALRSLGLDRLIEIYGSTETAGIGWRDAPGNPFRLLPWWCRKSEETIARETVRAIYRLPDQVAWHSEEQLVPLARRDGAVQIGSINVHPSRSRTVLQEHPAVANAAVRLMRADEGKRLKAFIVPIDPEGDTDTLRAELQRWATERLAPLERPRAYTFGHALPLGALGKPADWPIDVD